jgi:hypothetical protein
MNQKGSARRKPRALASIESARDSAIRAAIGRMLRAQYDLAAPLPERLENLLRRLGNADGGVASIPRNSCDQPQGPMRSRNWHPNEAL